MVIKVIAGLGAIAAPLAAHPEQSSQAPVSAEHGTNPSITTPPEGDGKGIAVRLEMPWKVLLKNEKITFYYILENRSDRAIPVAFPDGTPFGWPNGGQAFLEGILAPGSPEPGGIYSDVDCRWLKVEEAAWPPLDEERKVVKAWGELPAGQRIIWNRNRLRAHENFRVQCTKYLRAIQGHWLVGKGRWVSSEPVKVEVRDVPESQWTRVFEGEWSSYGRGLDSRTTSVLKIPLDGKWYLFSNFMSRICEVGERDEFDFKLDPVIGQLEATVKSSAGEKRHYYQMLYGLTRDIPWKAGPVSQYFPVPEPIPPDASAAVRNVDSVKMPKHAESVAKPAPAPSRSWLPWLAIGIAMVLLLAVAAWKWRGRKI